MMNMKTVIVDLKEAGLRNKVKAIVGGAPLSETFARVVGTDVHVRDAPEILITVYNLKEAPTVVSPEMAPKERSKVP